MSDEDPGARAYRCGRLGNHLAHYWRGPKFYERTRKVWLRETYYCIGQVVIEGAHHVVD